ncbi:hypothetical protein N8642_03335, partial [bacterium]|nr:hypothetical protein [bacterium]
MDRPTLNASPIKTISPVRSGFSKETLDAAGIRVLQDKRGTLMIGSLETARFYKTEPSGTTSSIVDRAVRYIEATPGAVSGNQGHSQTFALTCTLIHGYCLEGEVVYSLLETHYNPKCEPPWSNKELQHKVESAIATPPNKSSGWMLDSSDQRKRPSRVIDRKKNEIPKSDPKENILNFIGDFRCDGDDIRNASPCKIPRLIQADDFHRQGAYLIETLFEIDEKVNIVDQSRLGGNGKHQPANAGTTLSRNQWTTRLLEPTPERPGGYWIRMNPLDAAG